MEKKKFKEFIKNLNDADKQRATTILSYIIVSALAILTSCLNLLFDVENFDLIRFITRLCFNIAFAFIALILSLKDGRLSNETRRTGELHEMREEFKRTTKLVVDEDSFRQWNDQLYEKEKTEYIKDELSKLNILNIEYLYIAQDDLDSLKREPRDDVDYKGSKITLDQINDEQYQAIMIFRKGKFTFNKLPYTYFKSAYGRNDYKYFADSEGNDKKIEILAFAYRLIWVVLFSAILALAVINPNQETGQQIAYDTVSRLANVMTSIFLGYTLAHDEARRLIKTLEYKLSKVNRYLTELESGLFVAKDRSEIIQEKINEIKKRKAETLKNVIEPEVMEIEMTKEQLDNYLISKKDNL